jgi:hypothetical protein
MIAPVLAAVEVDTGWCDRAAAILDGPALEPGLEWVASALSADTLLAQITKSSQRTSALAGAVKSYTQMDRSSMQRIDVTEGLESTLVTLAQRFRDGVTVVRDYCADVPPGGRVRAFSHDQGRAQKHRSWPEHRTTHHRGTACSLVWRATSGTQRATV